MPGGGFRLPSWKRSAILPREGRKKGVDMSNLPEVTDTTFTAEILKNGPAAVKFWAEW